MQYTGFLCGCFYTEKEYPAIATWRPEWQPLIASAEERQMCGKFYYPDFVDFCFPATGERRGIRRFRLAINRSIVVPLGSEPVRNCPLMIRETTLYVAPYRMLLFAIRVETEAPADDITAALYVLRNAADYRMTQAGDFARAALDPLLTLYRRLSPRGREVGDRIETVDYGRLIENGNKFKLFQIANLSDDEHVSFEGLSDRLLFELGTLSPIGSCSQERNNSPSMTYFSQIMESSKLSFFNNWKGLALFDTFTLLGHEVPSYLHANWTENYFGMLYISQLYVKFYLFRLNDYFRRRLVSGERLLREFDEFENRCCFYHISYNFLPLEIYRSIGVGLEIGDEQERLYHMIERQKDNREKRNDQSMNKLLFYLTCLTMFSAIWDSSCLFNELYPFDDYIGSHLLGYRIVAYSLFFVVLLIIGINRMIGRWSK